MLFDRSIKHICFEEQITFLRKKSIPNDCIKVTVEAELIKPKHSTSTAWHIGTGQGLGRDFFRSPPGP